MFILLVSAIAFLNLGTTSAGNPSKVVFIGGTSQPLCTYELSTPITIQLQDSNGIPAPSNVSTFVINLSSNSSGGSRGVFTSDSNGNNKIDKVTIPLGATSASFYYYDLTVGTPKMTASGNGITSGFAQFNVTSANLLFTAGSAQTCPPTVYLNQLPCNYKTYKEIQSIYPGQQVTLMLTWPVIQRVQTAEFFVPIVTVQPP